MDIKHLLQPPRVRPTLALYAARGLFTAMPEAIVWILVGFFIVLPLIILAVKAAWWAFRMVFWLCIIGLSIAGAARRGEIKG